MGKRMAPNGEYAFESYARHTETERMNAEKDNACAVGWWRERTTKEAGISNKTKGG